MKILLAITTLLFTINGPLWAEPFLESNLTNASSWKYAGWHEPWNQKNIFDLRKGDDGQQALVIDVNVETQAILGKPKTTNNLSVEAGKVYRIEFEGRAVGQVEGVSLVMRRMSKPHTSHGSDSFPVSQDWSTYSTQIRVKDSDDDTAISFNFRGIGEYQIRSVRVTTADNFESNISDRPARGELLNNPKLAMGGAGWSFNAPRWAAHHKKLFDPNRKSVFTENPDGEPLVEIPAGFTSFLNYNELIELQLGMSYQLTVRGGTEAGDANVWVARPGQNIDIVKKLFLNFKDGIATATYTHEPPAFGTLSSRPQTFYLRAENFGEKDLKISEISFVETERGAELKKVPVAPQAAVEIDGLDPIMGTAAIFSTPLVARIKTSGLAPGASGKLKLINESGKTLATEEFTVQSNVEGSSVGASVDLDSLPIGWYEARLEMPDTAKISSYFVVIPPKPRQKSDLFLGAHIDFHDPRQFKYAALLGIQAARCFDFSWAEIEPEEGKYNFPLAEIDRYIEAGLEPMILLNASPKWATTAPPEAMDSKTFPPLWSHYPPETDDWKEFVRRTVTLLKPKGVKIYQVWNEPNSYFMKFNPKFDKSIEEAYVRLAKSAYEVIKQVDPEATVVIGGTAGQAFDFFEKCFKLGLLDYGDVVSYHAYGEVKMAAQGAEPFKQTVDKFHEMMTQYGEIKPIWDCESGYTIVDGTSGFRDSMTLLQGLLSREAGGIERYYIYSAEPRNFPGQSNFHMVVGFADRPLITQPLLAVYDRLLGDAKFKSIVRDEGNVHLFEFERTDGSRVFTGWKTGAEASLSTKLPISAGVVLDAFGNTVADIGEAAVELTSDVRYFVQPQDLSRLGR